MLYADAGSISATYEAENTTLTAHLSYKAYSKDSCAASSPSAVLALL
jgi:hypothetical protein